MKKITNNKIILGILIVALFLLTAGITYAYFEIVVNGNEDAKNIAVNTGNLSLYYNSGPEIIINDIYPGTVISKEFTVTNTGTYQVEFDILMSEMVNTIQNDELVYSLECHS